jgi:hypothetical protein
MRIQENKNGYGVSYVGGSLQGISRLRFAPLEMTEVIDRH